MHEKESAVFNKEELIEAIRAGNTTQAKDILLDAYLLFINQIDQSAFRGQEADLAGFSTDLERIFQGLNDDPKAQQCLCRAINKQDAHRKGAIRAFRGILDEIQTVKNMNVTRETTLEELNLDPEKVNRLTPGHSFTKDTTLQELYKHREDLLKIISIKLITCKEWAKKLKAQETF